MIYVVNVFLIVILGIIGNKIRHGKEVALALSFLLIMMIVVLRGIVGTDYLTYNSLYHTIVNIPFPRAYFESPMEYGYITLCYLAHFILPNSYWMIHFLMGSLTVCFYYLSIKRISPDYFLTTYLFVSMGYIYKIMNQERQQLAVSIIAYGVSFFLKKEKKKFLLSIIIASLFHTSSIIMLILFIPDIIQKFKQRGFILFCVIAIAFLSVINAQRIIHIFGLSNLFSRYLWYFSSSYDMAFRSNYIAHFLARIIIVIFICYPYRKVISMCSEYNRLYFMAIFLIVFQTASIFSSVFGRLIEYFYISLVYLIPLALKGMKSKIKNIHVLRIGIFVIATCYHYIYYATTSFDQGVSSYMFFWQ